MDTSSTHKTRFRKNLKQFIGLKESGKLNGKAAGIEKKLKAAARMAGLNYDAEIQSLKGFRPACGKQDEWILDGLEYIRPEDDNRENPAVSPDEIYQTITDKIINTIEKVGHLPWQKNWDDTGLFQGRVATNFKSKKPYRGINYFLLNFEQKVVDGKIIIAQKDFKNPYFLTFNQVEALKGTIRKGAKGQMIIYFTRLYKYQQADPDLEFGTYDRKKMIDWLNRNKSSIALFKDGLTAAEIADQSLIPVLKYYRVFNGEDVTGIDFGKLPKNDVADFSPKQKIEVAELIYEHFPGAPPIQHERPGAFYSPVDDTINMPRPATFSETQYYYTTLFHEAVHSTGHRSRLDRDMTGREGSKKYAFEELIAEMGAVYLCAESGILFRTIDNSAKYLNSWNSNLVDIMSKDNRFFFRAASRAQAASDYILDRNEKGLPAYTKQMVKLIDLDFGGKKDQPVESPKAESETGPYLVASDELIRQAADSIGAIVFETVSQVKEQFLQLTEWKLEYQVSDEELFELVRHQAKIHFDSPAGIRNALESIELAEKKRVFIAPDSELSKAIIKGPIPKVDELRFDKYVFGNYESAVWTNGFVLISKKSVARELLDREIAREKKRLLKNRTHPNKIKEDFKRRFDDEKPVDVKAVTPAKANYSGQATLLGYVYQRTDDGKPTLNLNTVLFEGRQEYRFNSDLFRFMVRKLPDSTLQLTSPNRAAVFVESGEPVGLLMPVLNTESLLPDADKTEPVRVNPSGSDEMALPFHRSNPRIPSVSKDDYGVFKSIGDLRKKVFAWAKKNIVGKVVRNRDLEIDIEIPWQGIKKAGSYSYIEKLVSIKKIPELLEAAKFIRKEKDKRKRPGIKSIYWFEHPIIIDEERYVAQLVVRETVQGTFYYDHRLNIKKPGGTSGKPSRRKNIHQPAPGSSHITKSGAKKKVRENAAGRVDIRLVKPKYQFPTEKSAWQSVREATGLDAGQVVANHTKKSWRWKRSTESKSPAKPQKADFVLIGLSERVLIDQGGPDPVTLQGPHALLTGKSKDKLYIVPFSELSELPDEIRDKKADDVFSQWHNYAPNSKNFEFSWPAGKPRPVGTAVKIIYASDKILQQWDRKGQLNLYEHSFDPGKRLAKVRGNILEISRIKLNERGILN